ncbi:3-hydroxyacyl-CoA dehydrogenase [Undibacterium terreum]|uniref:3-hydroxyacyl-CoA dehydrogenase n=1 Tax=Undibacterium terreum TaxID=1224302 RepID=UPI00227A2CB1|nr:3-hydroxyacyl-CoA dehydrogenase [Undibacterium terreum]
MSAVAEVHGSIGVIGVIGAGAMGRGIAQIAAQAGMQVKLFDVQADAAENARKAVLAQWEKLQQKGKLTEQQFHSAKQQLQVVTAMDAMADCEIVIEAIVERLDVKRDLFRQLEAIVSAGCILATNTSSLSVTAIAAGAAMPERVAGLHFFNPVPLMKVAEVIAGLRTRSEVVQRLVAFTHQTGHRPVITKDTPGFIVNHAGRAYGTEALRVLQEGVAAFPVIDAIMREAAGFRLGPFELLDLTGLDVSHPVMESIYQQYYQEPRYRPSVITAQRLQGGVLGRKTGRGFYDYTDGAQTVPQADAADAIAGAQPWTGWIWISPENPEAAASVRALLERCGANIENTPEPSADSLCLVAPLGEDVSTCVVRQKLDARRTLGIDSLFDCQGHLSLMSNPATDTAIAQQARALLLQSGQGVSLIQDSPGFVTQRILACVVNIGCDIVQQGICTPDDLDRAVELGLAYPFGPLAWGDKLGASRILTILQNMLAYTGDPRYRPSLWLSRRAQLELSLKHQQG